MLNSIARKSGSCGIRAPQDRLRSIGDYTSLTALVESDITEDTNALDGGYHYTAEVVTADGLFGETSASSTLRYIARENPGWVGIASASGRGGAEYAKIAKGGDIYQNGILMVRAAHSLYAAAGFSSHKVSAIVVEHGESDFNNVNFAANIQTLLTDYTTDLLVETGQTDLPIMILVQVSQESDRTSALQQALASQQNSRIHVASPSYFLASSGDHRTGPGHRQFGNYVGRVHDQVVNKRSTWASLRPTACRLTGTKAIIDFPAAACMGGLSLDTTIVASVTKSGFALTDATAAISSVAIVGNSVEVTLDGVPTSTVPRMTYAPATLAGNLRDNAPELGVDSEKMYRWCEHFDIAVKKIGAKTNYPPARQNQ